MQKQTTHYCLKIKNPGQLHSVRHLLDRNSAYITFVLPSNNMACHTAPLPTTENKLPWKWFLEFWKNVFLQVLERTKEHSTLYYFCPVLIHLPYKPQSMPQTTCGRIGHIVRPTDSLHPGPPW